MLPQRLRDGEGGCLDQRRPVFLMAVGRSGDRQSGDDLPLVVTDRRGDATQPEFRFLVVVSEIVPAHQFEFLFQRLDTVQ